MEISSSQLGDDGDYQIYFAQDGQFIGKRPREAGPPLTSYLALMDLYLVQIAP